MTRVPAFALLAVLLLCGGCGDPPPYVPPPAEPPPAPPPAAPDVPIPAVGDPYEHDGSRFVVVAAGRERFEYVAGEKTLVVAASSVGPLFTMVAGKGSKVEVDPAIPMVWVNGRQNKYMKDDRTIRNAARNQVLLLLELP